MALSVSSALHRSSCRPGFGNVLMGQRIFFQYEYLDACFCVMGRLSA